MHQLLIATRSAGKLPEIAAALNGLPLVLLSLNDIPELPATYEVEEPALTLEGNAIVKAMTLSHRTGLLTLADDTGLEVDALGGRPGVRTARYAPGTDADRYTKLLTELAGVPMDERTARFRTVVALYDPHTEKLRTCEGVYEGLITTEPRGTRGFGYDPVFFNPRLKKTNAEMTLDEKNEVSHRGSALRMARSILETEYMS